MLALPLHPMCCELRAEGFRVSVCYGMSADDLDAASPAGPPSQTEGPSPRSTVDHGAEARHYAAARRSPSSVGVPVESPDSKHQVSAGSSEPTSVRPAVEPRHDRFDGQALSGALRNASQSYGMPQLDFKLPWETGGMSLIFGSDSLLPKLEARALLPMPTSLEAAESTADRAAKRVKVAPVDQLFLNAVNFRVKEPDTQKEVRSWDRAIERWLVILAETPSASLVGASLPTGDVAKCMQIVRELFGKKSVNTVLKRANSILNYFSWCRENHPFRPPIPFEGAIIDEYLRFLRDAGKPVSVLRGFSEAVNFCLYVVGLGASSDRPVWSPWAKGLVSFLDLNRRCKRSRQPLTVAQVKWLESFLADVTNGLVDRYAAGVCLFAVFSRSRASDLKVCELWDLDLDDIKTCGKGFIECVTRNHKTARQTAQQAVPMPLIAPANGLGPMGWGPVWVQVAAECGRAFPQGKGPVLPAPLVDGGWMDRSVTSEELSAWLRSLLERGGFDVSSIASHSLKHTTLSWAAKWGMDKYIRTLLGHHSTGGKSLDSYARDVLAPALLEYEEMLRQVRIGSFAPDVSRSGRFLETPLQNAVCGEVEVQGAPPAKDASVPSASNSWEDAGEGKPGSLEGDLWSDEAFEGANTGASDEVASGHGARDGREVAQNETTTGPEEGSSDSSSSSSSDSESEGPEREVAERAQHFGEQGRVTAWNPSFEFFEHKRTMTVHVRTAGSSAETFNCGRKVTTDHRATSFAVFPEVRMCKQCKSNKPIRDVGGLVSALEAARRPK